MIRWKVWGGRLGVTALLVCVLQGLSFAQCEMCKTGLSNSAEGTRLIDGFRSGILFLMAMPYLLFGTLGLVVYVAHRRHRAGDPAAPEPPAAE